MKASLRGAQRRSNLFVQRDCFTSFHDKSGQAAMTSTINKKLNINENSKTIF